MDEIEPLLPATSRSEKQIEGTRNFIKSSESHESQSPESQMQEPQKFKKDAAPSLLTYDVLQNLSSDAEHHVSHGMPISKSQHDAINTELLVQPTILQINAASTIMFMPTSKSEQHMKSTEQSAESHNYLGSKELKTSFDIHLLGYMLNITRVVICSNMQT